MLYQCCSTFVRLLFKLISWLFCNSFRYLIKHLIHHLNGDDTEIGTRNTELYINLAWNQWVIFGNRNANTVPRNRRRQQRNQQYRSDDMDQGIFYDYTLYLIFILIIIYVKYLESNKNVDGLQSVNPV